MVFKLVIFKRMLTRPRAAKAHPELATETTLPFPSQTSLEKESKCFNQTGDANSE